VHDTAAIRPAVFPAALVASAVAGLQYALTILPTVLLLIASNLFMTVAWYAHLRNLADRPWYVAAIVSWGIALFEYLLQVPANRIGFRTLSLAQLKIIQEVITLGVFAVFAALVLKEPIGWRYIGAFCCLGGAVGFMFVGK